MKINRYLSFLICPDCQNPKLKYQKQSLICQKCHTTYQIKNNIPILISTQKSDYQENKQKKWFNHHYSKFSNRSYLLENWRLSMLNRIFNHEFIIKKTKRYLDIGCGATGYTTITAAKKYNFLSFGTDISFEAMVKAQKMAKINKVDNQTAFIVCSAQNLPFKEKIFDYISTVSVLEHLKDDQDAIREINRILNKKGFLFICVPNGYFKIWPFLWPFYLYNDLKIGHKRHYSITSLNNLTKGFFLKTHFYNGHLIKFLQLFLEKIHKINNKYWWYLEKKDINKNDSGVQLNALYQKQ